MSKQLTLNGKKLLQLRTDKSWSRRELGEKLGGLNEAAIGKWENERNQPTSDHIEGLLNIFKCNIKDLFYYKDQLDPLEKYLLKNKISNNTINGNNNALIASSNSGVINHHTACNCKLEQIEKAILEMENIDPKIAMQILKIIKTYKD